MVTTGQAAKLLGCSRRWIQKLQKKGRLHSVVDQKGTHHFAREELLAFARDRGRPGQPEGAIVARVFELFREQADLAEIVIQTQLTPETVRALWDEYRRPLGAPSVEDLERKSRELDELLGHASNGKTNGHASGTRVRAASERNGGAFARSK
jgi:excisionase family DNA binding protein